MLAFGEERPSIASSKWFRSRTGTCLLAEVAFATVSEDRGTGPLSRLRIE